MTDHDDARYNAAGLLITERDDTSLVAFGFADRKQVIIDLVSNMCGEMSIYLSRPQVDELIRMLVVARAEAWPVEGYDGEDEDDWESKEITL